MNIVYTTNDGFVPQVSACMTSVYENNKDAKELNIFVVAVNMSKEYQKILKSIAKKYHRVCNIIELNDIRGLFDFDVDTLGWHITVLARFFFDKLLPEWVEKVISLDGDTICLRSLKELWEIDMSKNVIAGSLAPTKRTRAINELGLTENDPYINAGVLLINLKKWRKEKTGERIINYYKEHNGRLSANDQDAINASMKDEIYILPPKYNFYNIFRQYPYRFMKKLMWKVPYFSKKEYMESVRNPVIIHYLWEERPWRAWNHHKYKDDYKKYLWMTYRKDTPDEKWWRLYFVCWYIFNFVMRPFPSFRYKIINYLIPKFMAYRKRQLKTLT